jgi:hypothetical protein
MTRIILQTPENPEASDRVFEPGYRAHSTIGTNREPAFNMYSTLLRDGSVFVALQFITEPEPGVTLDPEVLKRCPTRASAEAALGPVVLKTERPRDSELDP